MILSSFDLLPFFHSVLYFSILVEVSDLIDPLQRFIESSSLGEFSARLRMLYAFCQQCITMETTMATCDQGDARTKVSDIMLNIYSYYNQFSGAVKRRIEGARAPIEKELKVS